MTDTPLIRTGGPDGHRPDNLPAGVVTFLFSDIEGSTPRWESDPVGMRDLIVRHNELCVEVVRAAGGEIYQHTGDGVSAVFVAPDAAALAAIDLQRRFQTDAWGGAERLRIRVGVHTGMCEPTAGDYFGTPVNTCARVTDLANGDQIAITPATAALITGHDLRDRGVHQLKGLGSETIYTLHHKDLVLDDRPLRSPLIEGVRGLPSTLAELVGREEEIKRLSDLIARQRVVTLVGPGGVGKTHLASVVARTVADRFEDRAVFCDLVPITDADDVAEIVAETLGARVQPGLSLVESIGDYCASRRMLLVIDNAEHLPGAVRALATELLSHPNITMLITSREPVGLPGEQLFGLLPLPETDALELFRRRVAERDPDVLDDFDMASARAIVERLDGVPLALELAAARTRSLSLAELLERLDDRLHILRGGRTGRHQTLLDTILWSYESLRPDQADLFERLSVFAGDFSLGDAEAVCAAPGVDVLDVLGELVDKSMVLAKRHRGRLRYLLLGSLRHFGQERLDASGSAGEVRARHAAHFRSLVATETGRLLSAHEADGWETLGRNWANIRAAFEELLHLGNVDAAAGMVCELGHFAVYSMRFEALAWAEELGERFDLAGHPLEGSLLGIRSVLAYFTVDERAHELAMRGLAVDANDPYGYCRISIAAIVLNNKLDAEASAELTSEWVAALTDGVGPEATGFARLWGHAMRVFHLAANEPTVSAQNDLDEVERLARDSGSATALAVAGWAGGMVASYSGMGAAIRRWRRGADLAESMHPSHLVSQIIIGLLLHFSVEHDEVDAALGACEDALSIAREQHYVAGASHLFGVTAIALCRAGRAETAGRLLGAMKAAGHNPRENAIRVVGDALGGRASTIEAEGRSWSVDEACSIALDTMRAVRGERGVMS